MNSNRCVPGAATCRASDAGASADLRVPAADPRRVVGVRRLGPTPLLSGPGGRRPRVAAFSTFYLEGPVQRGPKLQGTFRGVDYIYFPRRRAAGPTSHIHGEITTDDGKKRVRAGSREAWRFPEEGSSGSFQLREATFP